MPALRLTLLGACQAAWHGEPLSLPRRQMRALLYRLAAQIEPVSRGHLAFLFWPDEPDAAARRHLTRLISSLRAALPSAEALIVEGDAVSLNPAWAESDSYAFIQGCAAFEAGDSDLIAATRTLSLYRGPFMAGFALPNAAEYDAWQSQTAHELAARYLRVLEKLVQRHTEAGNTAAAIACAQRYLQADELCERMHRALISLHAMAGDQAAAARQYERCVVTLERELGIQPMPETRAALRAMPAPTAPTPASVAVLPTLSIPLIGRDDALAQLQKAAGRLREGGLILISGQSGIGKSRLLREYIGQERALVLCGTCHAGSQSLPYHPLAQALRPVLDQILSHSTSSMLPWLSELLPLLPELRARLPGLPAPMLTSPEHAQARLFAAITHVLLELASGDATPILLCLDDVHWADEASLGWLHYLAGQWSGASVIVIATTRPAPPPALNLARDMFARAGRLAEIELLPLNSHAVREMVSRVSGDAPPALADQIGRVTGGNAFFILEIMRDLRDNGRLSRPPDNLPLPATVRDAILSRAGRLSPIGRQVLEAAAVAAPTLDVNALREIAARTPDETAAALDELVAHQFLETADTTAGRGNVLQFPHALLQTAIYDHMSPWRRRLMHRRAGEVLARRRLAGDAALAHHFIAAEAWDEAVSHLRQAAEHAAQAHAYETALEHTNLAIELLTQRTPSALPEPDEQRMALLRQRLALNRVLVRLPDWQAGIEAVLALAHEQHDDADALRDAELEALEAQISLHVLRSDFARVEQTAEQALALAVRAGRRVAEARIRQTLGWHLADALGRSREGLSQLQTACQLAREADAGDVLYLALCNLAFVQRAEGQAMRARDSALEALALTHYRADAAPHPAYADALRELGEANAYLGHWEAAHNQLRPLLAVYQTLNDPWAYGTLLHNYGLYSASMGQHDEAIACMRRLVALSESVGLPADSDYGIWHRAGLARVLLAAQRVAEAGAVLDALRTDRLSPGRPYLAWARAAGEYRLSTGDPARALDVLRPAASWWRTRPSPHDADVLLLLAQAELADGDRAAATATVSEATRHLLATDLQRHHVRLYATRYRVTGDPADLSAARDLLAAQAAGFTDPDLRATFLRAVPLHREIATFGN